MIALDCTDDLFRTYTLFYKKINESIQKGSKGWVLVEKGVFNDPTDHWQNGLNRVGSKMRFYQLRNNQHQRNKLIFRIA